DVPRALDVRALKIGIRPPGRREGSRVEDHLLAAAGRHDGLAVGQIRRDEADAVSFQPAALVQVAAEADDLMPLFDEALGETFSQEAGGSGHECFHVSPFHLMSQVLASISETFSRWAIRPRLARSL